MQSKETLNTSSWIGDIPHSLHRVKESSLTWSNPSQPRTANRNKPRRLYSTCCPLCHSSAALRKYPGLQYRSPQTAGRWVQHADTSAVKTCWLWQHKNAASLKIHYISSDRGYQIFIYIKQLTCWTPTVYVDGNLKLMWLCCAFNQKISIFLFVWIRMTLTVIQSMN